MLITIAVKWVNMDIASEYLPKTWVYRLHTRYH